MTTQDKIIEELKAYFEQYADAEYFTDSASPCPNEEMRMLALVEELSAMIESYKNTPNHSLKFFLKRPPRRYSFL